MRKISPLLKHAMQSSTAGGHALRGYPREVGAAGESRLHDTTTRCEDAGFRVTDTVDQRVLPPVSYLSGEPTYGMLSVDVNGGLRLPQSRPLTVEAYNTGCVNPHGCVNNEQDGFGCLGPVKKESPFMRALYTELQMPYAPDSFEMQPPPDYVVGTKATGVNSVTGWRVTPEGRYLWEQESTQAVPCPIGSAQGEGA